MHYRRAAKLKQAGGANLALKTTQNNNILSNDSGAYLPVGTDGEAAAI